MTLSVKGDILTKLGMFIQLMTVLYPSKYKGITPSQLRILVNFLTLPIEHSMSRFSRLARQEVVSRIENMTTINLNMQIYKMIDNGYINRDADNVLYIDRHLTKGAFSLLAAIDPLQKYVTDYEASKLDMSWILDPNNPLKAAQSIVKIDFNPND